MGYNYNGKLKSAEILLHEDGSFDMIRRAETPRDYFATFDCFPIFEKMLEEALDLGWGILAECFEPNETGLKTSLLQERWPKKDALN